MANTPNMNLALPVPSVTAGPAYATALNTAMTLVDSHNHTTGQGSLIPTAALNINADVGFNGFNATLLRSARFTPQAAALALGTDANCLYSVGIGGDLYYNNGSGASVQITSGTALSATSLGGIGGLAGTTGSANYASGSGTFTFWQNTNQAATMDGGPIVIRDTAASALGITLKSPTSLAGAFALTLPTALPASTKIMTVSSTGQLQALYDVDGSTLQVLANVLSVKTFGIGTTQIANLAVTASKIANATITTTQIAAGASITGSQLAAGTVTRSNLAAVGQQIGANPGTFTTTSATLVDVGTSVTITTSGRPVIVMLIPAPGGSLSASINSTISSATIQFTQGASTNVAAWQLVAGTVTMKFPISFTTMDTPAAGTYTYKLQAQVNGGSTLTIAGGCELVAYELA